MTRGAAPWRRPVPSTKTFRSEGAGMWRRPGKWGNGLPSGLWKRGSNRWRSIAAGIDIMDESRRSPRRPERPACNFERGKIGKQTHKPGYLPVERSSCFHQSRNQGREGWEEPELQRAGSGRRPHGRGGGFRDGESQRGSFGDPKRDRGSEKEPAKNPPLRN